MLDFKKVAGGALSACSPIELANKESTDTADDSFDSAESSESFDASDINRSEHTILSSEDESVVSDEEHTFGEQLDAAEGEEIIATDEASGNRLSTTESHAAAECVQCIENTESERSSEESQHHITKLNNLKTELDITAELDENVEINLGAIRMTDNSALSKEIERLNNHIDTVEAEKQSLEEKFAAVNEQLSQVMEQMKEAKLENKNSALKENRNDLSAIEADEQAVNAILSSESSENGTLLPLQEQVNSKTQDIDNLQSELEEANDLIEVLGLNFDVVKAENLALNEEIDRLNTTIKAIEADKRGIEAEQSVNEQQDEVEMHIKSMDILTSKFVEDNDLTAVLKANLNAANTEKKALEEQVSTLAVENASLLASLDAKCLESFNFERSVAQTEQQLSKITKEKDGLSSKLIRNEEDSMKLTLALQEALADSKSKAVGTETLMAEVTSKEKLLDTANSTIISLRGEVESIRRIMSVENATLLSSLDNKCRESFMLERSLEEKLQQISKTTELNKSLESALNTTKQKAAKLEQTLQNSRFDSKKLAREVERLADELDAKKSALHESKINITSLKKEVSSSRNQLADLSDTTQKLKESNANLVETVSKLFSENEGLSCLVQVKTSFIEALESKLKEANHLKAALETNFNEAEADNQALNDKIAQLDIQIDSIETEKQNIIAKMNHQITVLKTENQNLTDEMVDASGQILKISAENAMLKSKLNQKVIASENLERISEEKQQQVMTLTGEITQLTAEKRILDAMLERKEVETTSLEKGLTEAKQRLNEQIDELTKQVSTVKSEKQLVWERLEKAKEQLQMISSENVALQSKLEEKALVNVGLEELALKQQRQISTLTEARAQLQANMTVKEEQVVKLENALEEAHSNEKELKRRIEDADTRARTLESDYNAATEKIEVTNLLIKQKDKVATDLLDALSEAMSSSDERDEELAIMADENYVLTEKLDQAKAKISRMHSKVQELRLERNHLIGRFQGSSSQLETKVEEVSARFKEEYAEFHERVEHLNADILKLQHKNTRLKRENAKLREDKDAAEERISSLEAEMKKSFEFEKACIAPMSNAVSRDPAAAVPPSIPVTFDSSVNARPTSPVLSSASSSGFIDAEVAKRVAKAFEMAKQKLST